MSNADIVTVWAQASSLAIVIPKNIAEKAGIRAGDKLVIKIDGEELKIRKLEW